MPARRSSAPKAPAALEVVIDYPQQGELIRPGHYAIRVTAAAAAQVQVRLDATEWLECRPAVGFFWHDWAPQKPGSVKIMARARVGRGRWNTTPARACFVEA